MNGDWGLRNVASDIERKGIEMTVVNVERGKKKE
jgi:hypothetical protein